MDHMGAVVGVEPLVSQSEATTILILCFALLRLNTYSDPNQ